MKLEFHRTLAAPREVVWPLLTLPDEMNRWSLAPITAVSPGEQGKHDAPGAVRRATVPAFGLSATLDEEIVEAVYPERYVYRVVRGGAMRGHRGVQTLTAVPGGTALLWEVSFESIVPGLSPLLGAILRPRLEQSLTALERLLASG